MAGANQVRLIAGRHRGRRLHFVPGRGLRPTPDRVRETLFNWLHGAIRGARCLDLFAGSGALGLEAVSRGAGYLLAVEQHRAAAQRLRDNVILLGEQTAVDVVQQDALRLLRTPPGQPFDIVFVDPPFAAGLLAPVVDRLAAGGWLSEHAMIYLEQDARAAWPELPVDWCPYRDGTAGQSAYRLLRRSIAG